VIRDNQERKVSYYYPEGLPSPLREGGQVQRKDGMERRFRRNREEVSRGRGNVLCRRGEGRHHRISHFLTPREKGGSESVFSKATLNARQISGQTIGGEEHGEFKKKGRVPTISFRGCRLASCGKKNGGDDRPAGNGGKTRKKGPQRNKKSTTAHLSGWGVEVGRCLNREKFSGGIVGSTHLSGKSLGVKRSFHKEGNEGVSRRQLAKERGEKVVAEGRSHLYVLTAG